MSKKGVLVIISGFSGSGKGTVVKELVKKYDDYSLSISATTRNPREGEVDGREYFFLTKDKFKSMIDNNEFIEWAEYVSNYYGTPKSYIKDQLDKGKKVILEIEMQGALKVKEDFPETVMIFLTAPDFTVLKDRLINRGTEDISVVNKRLSRAIEETEYIKYYDYLVINNDLVACVEKVNDIINKEQDKNNCINDFIEKFTLDGSKYISESR